MSIDSEIHGKPAADLIRTDSYATLGSPSLLGSDKLVNVAPGSPVGEPVPDTREGYLLPLGKDSAGFGALTESGNELMQQLNKLSVEFTAMAERLNRGEGTIGRFLNDEAFYNNLNATIRDTQSLIRRSSRAGLAASSSTTRPLRQHQRHQRPAPVNRHRPRAGAARPASSSPTTPLQRRAHHGRPLQTAPGTRSTSSSATSERPRTAQLLTDEAIYNDARPHRRVNTAAERLDNVVPAPARRGHRRQALHRRPTLLQLQPTLLESVKLIYDFRQNPRKYLTIKFELF